MINVPHKTTGVSLRFITISSLLLLAIASILFAAFHCKGGKNVGFVAASDEEVRPKNVYIVPAAAAAREKTLKTRKMVVDKTIILNKKAEEKLVARGKHTTFRRITLSGNKNVNFVAFTEDYHKPRHHPPKNN
ncbi:putative Root meristem growth factor [Helianthus annuus]|uniref:Uncharacterized protein n=1 Tax=Helianthus annuus TaxID=4232 RepID=A0A251S2V7_HELAN|nr:uncharacterized protein LOC110917522 [Helianthus annuus]KAF5762097.1 hypothetical protein HanXRQr2_Chr16g0772871 [Helianthus annuus]KAJ0823202.1 hypothetical protein HanPSC8_Chr16g0741071 [Helianthus annuus]KAJ0837914.1 putative Root meristem growth factor [Helianthus annuus]